MDLQYQFRSSPKSWTPVSSIHWGPNAGLITLRTAGKFVTIFADTGSWFERNIRVKSSIGKDRDFETLDQIPLIFPLVGVSAARTFFGMLNVAGALDLAKIRDDLPFDPTWSVESANLEDGTMELEDVISYAVVGGRYRILTQVLSELIRLKGQEGSKRQILHRAVSSSLICVRKDLAARFAEIGLANGDRVKALHADEMNEQLRMIWTSMSLCGGEIAIPGRKNARHDLMRLGLGNFDEDAEDQDEGMFAITEHIIPDAIRYYFEGGGAENTRTDDRDELQKRNREISELSKFCVARDLFWRVIEQHGNRIPGRGNLLESLVFRALLRSEFQHTLVKDLAFVRPVVSDRV